MRPCSKTHEIAGIVGRGPTHITSLVHGVLSINTSAEEAPGVPPRPNANSGDGLEVDG